MPVKNINKYFNQLYAQSQSEISAFGPAAGGFLAFSSIICLTDFVWISNDLYHKFDAE
jgi:hypothetical protein